MGLLEREQLLDQPNKKHMQPMFLWSPVKNKTSCSRARSVV